MASSTTKPQIDHIFGDIDLPEKSAAWLHKRYEGVCHQHHKSPRNTKPGDEICLKVTTSANLPVESVKLWMSKDDWETHYELDFHYIQTTWKTALWSYLKVWEFTLPAQPKGTMLRYKIGAKLQGSPKIIYADSQTHYFQKATNYSIWINDDTNPDWAKDAIIYQIFIDRFNPGEGKSWNELERLKKPFGGTIKGITEKLAYIRSMGFNTIWLTPIYQSPSHHGYDISDYYEINSRMGTKEDFIDLLHVAHQNQIRIILDFVANHCSSEHPFFLQALEDPQSPYHDYFVWKEWPQYECFYNVPSMPKLNLAFGSPARSYLLQCAQYWLEIGVDGFRLDHAHGPEQDFWVEFRRACNQVKPEGWTFAEINQPAEVQTAYVGGVGGSLDFLLCQAIRLTFAQKTWSLERFVSFLQSHFNYFPEEFRLPSFVDNHDMNRFITAANDDERLLKMALTILYTLPEPPIVYYGTEVPLSQNKSIHKKNAQGFDEARLPMDWDQIVNIKLRDHLAKLAQIRNKYPAVHQTVWQVNQSEDEKDLIVLGKPEPNDVYLIINRSSKKIETTIKVDSPKRFLDVFEGEYIQSNDSQLDLVIRKKTVKLILYE